MYVHMRMIFEGDYYTLLGHVSISFGRWSKCGEIHRVSVNVLCNAVV